MRIRPAQVTDLGAAAMLWEERLALLRQWDSLYTPAADAKASWMASARRWLGCDECHFAVADIEGRVVGFIAVALAPGPAGLAPERLGTVRAMAIDLHQSYPGLSGKLLASAKAWLRERGIDVLQVSAPSRYAVEEAFWQGQGAQSRSKVYWLAT